MQSYTIVFFIFLASFFSACLESESTKKDTQQVSVKHFFSNKAQEDVFKLEAKGSDILKGRIFFTITTAKGTVIHTESFDGYSLLDYGLIEKKPNPTDDDRRAYIKSRMTHFFDNENFLVPAIKAEEVFEPEYSEKVYWENIKNDVHAIGFYYLIGEEDGRSIAYSKTLNKVVMYFNCC